MRKRKLQTELEKTYKPDAEPIRKLGGETTIQTWPVNLLQDRSHTGFTFHPEGRAGEMTQEQFQAAFGSEDPKFVFGLIGQLANVGPQSKSPDEEGLEFALTALRNMSPGDPLEAMGCAQSIAFLRIAMMSADRLAEATVYTDRERAEKPFSGFSGTCSALMDAVDRHRFLAEHVPGRGSGATQDPAVLSDLLNPVTHIGTENLYIIDDGLEFVRAAVTGMAPRDPFEQQSCSLAAMLHSWAMRFANRFTHAEDLAELFSTERSLNRLSRRFCALMGTFDHHRYGAGRAVAVRQPSAEAQEAIVSSVHYNGVKMNGKSNGHAPA